MRSPYQARFELGYRHHDDEHEAAHSAGHVGQVGEQHLDAAVEQRNQKANVARQAVQLGDDEPGLLSLAGGERLGELGPRSLFR